VNHFDTGIQEKHLDVNYFWIVFDLKDPIGGADCRPIPKLGRTVSTITTNGYRVPAYDWQIMPTHLVGESANGPKQVETQNWDTLRLRVIDRGFGEFILLPSPYLGNREELGAEVSDEKRGRIALP
jgi:hypothetical protein